MVILGADIWSQSLQEGPLNHQTPYPAHHWDHGVSCNPDIKKIKLVSLFQKLVLPL